MRCLECFASNCIELRVPLNTGLLSLCLSAVDSLKSIDQLESLCAGLVHWRGHIEMASFGGMLGFGLTLQLIGCCLCSCYSVLFRVLGLIWALSTLLSRAVRCLDACPLDGKRESTTNLGIELSVMGSSFTIGPDIRQDYPLNLSILISGGKETNKDSPSNGE